MSLPPGGRKSRSAVFTSTSMPSRPATEWTCPPLRLECRGSHFYGRGTADMKGTVTSALAALRAADAADLTLGYDPVLLFCTDEEEGCIPASGTLPSRA